MYVFSNNVTDPPGSEISGPIGRTSSLPSGVNVAFLDGSVRFVEDGVAPRTWWSIATMASGGVVSSDSPRPDRPEGGPSPAPDV
jgi:prepilin-type processing-associated H-X9-DG protein